MKTFIGKIDSTKMEKTVVVIVENIRQHPIYKKIVKQKKRIKADSGGFELKNGDIVKIGETRPISRQKHFKVLEVIKKL